MYLIMINQQIRVFQIRKS